MGEQRAGGEDEPVPSRHPLQDRGTCDRVPFSLLTFLGTDLIGVNAAWTALTGLCLSDSRPDGWLDVVVAAERRAVNDLLELGGRQNAVVPKVRVTRGDVIRSIPVRACPVEDLACIDRVLVFGAPPGEPWLIEPTEFRAPDPVPVVPRSVNWRRRIRPRPEGPSGRR